ncbi:xanthine dehydrogenase family protein molybdopterin-binding subunit [Rhizobium ruizarguesonis]|uniref:xanthine dehydrogenase family protein molybdopterin-binding subunit n=1 Tax=Rhizobium ruizarguesonis TaxID=2081791 RepID=UPI0010308316|nr:molybdopterin cofactor-binding domain-containing protein [Rhizobium ruizarguesonis]NEH75682.1 molybdopterin-dependent oxidoreductase [Rhizobium ruizarguesonis]NEJ16684.1 molybdopterin-dependent oxidoreductase [Rhizobium ruizarguesonis]NEJ85508.1 molybdopterin-dependent oxidoreductase [Rhizobium ruizarguesonis]NEJ96944.1 molybdopterin-dependent oxidoreductase [Rhizobium ruizarguesonis]NEK30496.1 molybdopterin-dependent oxidoreductase [Rhizobium ruizarguesonis]
MARLSLFNDRDLLATTRREFLTGSASLLLGVAFAGKAAAMVPAADSVANGAGDAKASGFTGFVPDAFIRISSDGRIILIVPNAEMGQGIATTEAMMIAEELEVGLDQVEVALAPADAIAYDQSILHNQITGASTSVRAFFKPLRQAGSAARMMLIGAAADMWGVAASECTVSRAVVFHQPSGRSAKYSDLAEAARAQPVPSAIPLKSVAQFKVIGQPLKRVDTPEKVTGAAKFGIDAIIPGMRYAALKMCPTIGGAVGTVKETAARSSPGVIDVIQIHDAVAVIGETYWAARTGAELLDIEWDHGPNSELSSDALWTELRNAKGTPIVAKAVGDIEKALSSGVRIAATYEVPYLAHAALEPINTTIHVRADACDVWVSTQVPKDARIVTSEIVGLPPEKINIHTHLIGGGFGRRLAVDTIQQAARFGKLVNYPIKIIWTREQDIMHDRFRPAYHDNVVATLDRNSGLPLAFHHKTTCSSVLPYFNREPWPEGKLDPDAVSGSVNLPYDIPSGRWEWLRHDSPIALNWWRGVGETHNVFVVESFIDELAVASGTDPVEYRRKLVDHNPRAKAVLDKVEEASDWRTPLMPGFGRGVSLHQSFGSFAALVVEVGVDESGSVALRRLTAAVDCGVAVNPDSVMAQIQGGVLFGLSAALYNGITFKNGTVQQSNFNNYRQIRMNEVPPFDVFVMPSDEDPGGMGEVGTASSTPALTNAIYAATGVRLRSTPIDRHLLARAGNRDRPPGNLQLGLESNPSQRSITP